MADDDVPTSGYGDHLFGGRQPETEDEMALNGLAEALRAPGTPSELTRMDETVAAMVAAQQGALVPLPVRREPSNRRRGLVAAGSALGVVAVTLMAGTAAAAYSGALPAPLQDLAHRVIGAPAAPADPTGDSTGASSPAGRPSSAAPSASGPSNVVALAALCRAYQRDGGTLPPSLQRAADQAGLDVDAFCTSVLAQATTPAGQTNRPSTPPGQTTKPTAPPGQTNKPTAPPGQTNKPTAPPGQTVKPTAPPGQTKTPPGSTRTPSAVKTPPGSTKTPPGSTKKP
ncbi:MAG: hypothetical protein LCI03_18280 [Actinobacteria bacterium]|nr:hypothetical protein [Actinomycetota bacterium]